MADEDQMTGGGSGVGERHLEEEEDQPGVVVNRRGDEVDEDDSPAEADNVLEGRKRKAPAPVWSHGGLKLADGGAMCNVLPGKCSVTFYSESSNTSNLTHHIIEHHRDLKVSQDLRAARDAKRKKKDEYIKKKSQQGSMLSFVTLSKGISDKKKEDLEKALIKHIVVSNKPFSDTECATMRELLFTAEPGYILPPRGTISNRVSNYYKVGVNNYFKLVP